MCEARRGGHPVGMNPWRRIGACALAGSLLLATAGRAELTPAELDRETYQVARDLMSPFCPGRTLADCPSPYARDVREQIRDALAGGMASDEVAARVTAELGDEVRGRPQSAWGWWMPALVTLGGVIAAVLVIRRLGARGRGEPSLSAPAPSSAEEPLAARLEAELRRLDA